MKTVLLILLSLYLNAQVKRSHRYSNPNIVTIYPSRPVIFGRSAIDLVALNIMVDSMDIDRQKAIIYAYCPNKPFDRLRFYFAEGSDIMIFKSKEDGNYGEYNLSVEDYIVLRDNQLTEIWFDQEEAGVSNGYFFCDFISSLK